MITACAALDRSWALPAAFCLFAFAGFAQAERKDPGNFDFSDCPYPYGLSCLYECKDLLSKAMPAATDDASSTGEWRYGKHKGGGTRHWGPDEEPPFEARCASVGKVKDGWMAVCSYPNLASRRKGSYKYQIFVEKTGKIEELRERDKIEIRTGCRAESLKFEVQKNEKSETYGPVIACWDRAYNTGIYRLCTPPANFDFYRVASVMKWLRTQGNQPSDFSGTDSDIVWLKMHGILPASTPARRMLIYLKDVLPKNHHFPDIDSAIPYLRESRILPGDLSAADSAMEWLAMQAVNNDDATIKISVVAGDGSGEKTTSELFSLPLKGAEKALNSLLEGMPTDYKKPRPKR